MRQLSVFFAAAMLACSANAQLNPIPQASGFSGNATLGIVTNDIASSFYQIDDADRIDGLDAPDNEEVYTALALVDFRYTLEGGRTQFTLGTQIHDALFLDYTQQLSVRHRVDNVGIMSLGVVFNGLMQPDTWADPYLTNAAREDTDRSSRGLRAGWESILNSNFSVDATYRKIEIDNEESGSALPLLTANERDMLDRNGATSQVNASYYWKLSPRLFLIPAVIVGRNALDGSAVSCDSAGAKLDIGYQDGVNIVTVGLYAGQSTYDEGHPAFANTKADSSEFVGGVSYIRRNFFGQKHWASVVNLAYGDSDSDIDFFDTEIRRLAVGAMYIF